MEVNTIPSQNIAPPYFGAGQKLLMCGDYLLPDSQSSVSAMLI